MGYPSRFFRWLGSGFTVLALAACQAATQVSTIMEAGTLPPSPSSTITITHTPTSAPTETPTNTPTETPTNTPTPPYNAPGKYKINKCVQYQYGGAPFSVLFCVTSVTVNTDSTMQFYVSWKILAAKYSGIRVRKYSDTNNRNMFLSDNLETRYDHIGTGGCAAELTYFNPGDTCYGWFLFPAAQPGATSFQFNDADNGVFIADIVLLNIPPTPTATLTGTQKTPTPTKSKAPSATQTFTPTIDPNTVYNAPGTYWIYKCVPYPASGRLAGADSITLCLNTVVVNEDGTMKFNFVWQVVTQYDVIKDSDANNKNIYLEDNLENRYPHIQTGGCAAEDSTMMDPVDDCSGWFLFPAAQPGATSFQFVNSGLLLYIKDIVLIKK